MEESSKKICTSIRELCDPKNTLGHMTDEQFREHIKPKPPTDKDREHLAKIMAQKDPIEEHFRKNWSFYSLSPRPR